MVTIQDLIQTSYSGDLDQTITYVNLTIQAIGVLVGGIVIWRASIAFQRKKMQERRRNPFFETTYSKHWRK
jgi:hypothetical protein